MCVDVKLQSENGAEIVRVRECQECVQLTFSNHICGEARRCDLWYGMAWYVRNEQLMAYQSMLIETRVHIAICQFAFYFVSLFISLLFNRQYL